MKLQELNLTKNEIKEILINLKLDNIEHVYRGKRNSCLCGCKGAYYFDKKNIEELLNIIIHDLELINEYDIDLIIVNNKITIIDIFDTIEKDICTSIYLTNPIEIK